MTNTYLIPIVFTGRDIPLEYLVVNHKADMRFKFCKANKDRIISLSRLEGLLEHFESIITKENRIIIPDGKTARLFLNELYNKYG